ncbi:hypothetical protein SDA16_15565, partial [Legionella pneumophila serogroup 1]
SLKIERSVYTLNPFQKITILIRFQSISRAFDNFHSLVRERIEQPILLSKSVKNDYNIRFFLDKS